MKKEIKILIYSLFLLNCLGLKAQLYNAWAFGPGYYMDFFTSTPNIKNIITSFHWDGGSASICDSNGNIRIYLAGSQLFNGSFQPIQNGNNIKVDFAAFCVKNACILPPKENNYLLIHCMSFQTHSVNGGLYYSKINMLKNNGIGVVEMKNYPLLQDSISGFVVVPDTTVSSYLIIAFRFPDSFFIYKAIGDTVFFVNKTAFNIPISLPFYYYEPQYDLLFPSNDGKHIFYYRCNYQRHAICIEYEIDKKNNSLINGKKLFEHDFTLSGNKYHILEVNDACISPNDSFIYLLNPDTLYQYSRYNGSLHPFGFKNPDGSKQYCWRMQLGPDGKIYLFSVRHEVNDTMLFINRISYPNLEGEQCKIEANIYKTKLLNTVYSLPMTLSENLIVNFNYFQDCSGTVEFINKSNFNLFKNFIWYFNDVDSLSGINAFYKFPKTGKFLIKLKGISNKGYFRIFSDSVEYIKPPTANFTTDTTIGCQWLKFKFYDASVKDTVNAAIGESWLWHFGDGTTDTVKNPEHIYTKTGKYKVKLIYSNGFCTDTIEKEQAVEIIEAPRPGFKMSQTHYCSPYLLQIT
ncbi:MAG TPA: PKD domain-containing protein, partial [Bacteroidia bacterium]|nr:PKD domain-containing protein [Bacteroidia bacterium]HRS59714.1 PKD domain-containing protein [Bacteroidia bacterium]HRU68679.1 PKD domain-containing protein [Bacteroidia bacterium]